MILLRISVKNSKLFQIFNIEEHAKKRNQYFDGFVLFLICIKMKREP
mgnify:CR=1 FL=1